MKLAYTLAPGRGETNLLLTDLALGLAQDGLRLWLGPLVGEAGALWLGLAWASLLFGLAHCLSVTYVVFATVLGVFLGWLYLATGDLVAPIVAHALYDFIALLVLVRKRDPANSGDAPLGNGEARA